MWCWRRLEKKHWTDRVKNEDVLLRAKEEKEEKKARLTEFVTSCVGTAF